MLSIHPQSLAHALVDLPSGLVVPVIHSPGIIPRDVAANIRSARAAATYDAAAIAGRSVLVASTVEREGFSAVLRRAELVADLWQDRLAHSPGSR